jgi:ppGpp synthetase/RelA/SpoT-type nucleotidyltranferase
LSRAPSASDARAFLDRCRETLEDELADEGLVSASVQARVKTADAVAAKRARRPGLPMNDYLGLRVTVDHVGLLERAAETVRAWAPALGLKLRKEENRFDRPGAGGYRALHFDFEIRDPAATGVEPDDGVEVQITTALLAVIARLSHDLVYRTPGSDAEYMLGDLEKLAEEGIRLDARIASLASTARTGVHKGHR